MLAPIAQALEQTLTPSDGATNDNFGRPIAISGNTLVVGVVGDYVTLANQGPDLFRNFR